MRHWHLVALAGVVSSGCVMVDNDRPGGRQGQAILRTAQGAPAGTALAVERDGMIFVTVRAQNVSPGVHGTHVHMTGRCDPPGFTSAGGHWNPAGTRHGLEVPGGPHAGDMPNLTVAANGRGTLQYRLQGGSFADLLDGDGSALIIHAAADDQRTEPSGNSGDRIACGVFTPR